MSIERLWAGWRSEYVTSGAAANDTECVLCGLVALSDSEAMILERTAATYTVMNAYPYTSGHLMVTTIDHLGSLTDLGDNQEVELARAVRRAVSVIEEVLSPGGINIGANIGAAAGAGVPGHLHVHVLPRWTGDTNFMTSIAELRVLPEDLRSTYDRLYAKWPQS